MSTDGPNSRYLRVSLDCAFTADALARSWREGRVEPDEVLERDGRRLTFREACREDGFLRKEIGPLPDTRPSRRRSWFAERRFRREAWRKVVENGELGPALLAERIDRLSHEVETLEDRCAKNDERLAAADRREKDLVAALRTGAADAEELEAICKACEDARTDGLGMDALGRSQAGILKRLIEKLRASFSALSDESSCIVRVSDSKRIEQIVRFHKEAHEKAESYKRKLAEEKHAWARILKCRKKEVDDAVRDAKESIERARKNAECQLNFGIRNYRQMAALHSKWRNTVSEILFQRPSAGKKHLIGDVRVQRPEWLTQALLSYAPMVAPEAVLGIFKSGIVNGAKCGFLVSWDGLHWRTSMKRSPGFLAWGWHGRIVVKWEMAYWARCGLEDGTDFGTIFHIGHKNELEPFLEQINEVNQMLPAPSFKNGGIESFRRISALAIKSMDSIVVPTLKPSSHASPDTD